MSDQTPPDPYGQPPRRPQQPGGPPPPGAPPGYQYQPSGFGLYGLWFIYTLTQDEFGADFGDRLFGSLQDLATGIFYTAVLLAVSVWLGKQKTAD